MEIQPIHQNAAIVDPSRSNNNLSDLDFFQSLPPGIRFQPTDEELIVYYLANKVNNKPLPRNKINNVNLYDYNPDTLSHKFKESGEKEWYFFTPRNRKYKNGQRPNRAAGNGYWKATGADKPIENSKGEKVGFRKALVFYVGRPPKGDKTSWIMHEYRVCDPPKCDRSQNAMKLDNWVLCRIYKKHDRTLNAKNVRPESVADESEIHEGNVVDEGEAEMDHLHQDSANNSSWETHTNETNHHSYNNNFSNGDITNSSTYHGQLIDHPYIWSNGRGLPQLPPSHHHHNNNNFIVPTSMHPATGNGLMTMPQHNFYLRNNFQTQELAAGNAFYSDKNSHSGNGGGLVIHHNNAYNVAENLHASQPLINHSFADQYSSEQAAAPDNQHYADQFLMPTPVD